MAPWIPLKSVFLYEKLSTFWALNIVFIFNLFAEVFHWVLQSFFA